MMDTVIRNLNYTIFRQDKPNNVMWITPPALCETPGLLNYLINQPVSKRLLG